MKNILLLAIVILIIGIFGLLELRYALIVDSPVVAKLDKLTGDVWIVNAGVWRKVQMEAPTAIPAAQAANTGAAGRIK